jgi:hypothetical protein
VDARFLIQSPTPFLFEASRTFEGTLDSNTLRLTNQYVPPEVNPDVWVCSRGVLIAMIRECSTVPESLEAGSNSPTGGPENILLVEDDGTVRRRVSTLLKRKGI